MPTASARHGACGGSCRAARTSAVVFSMVVLAALAAPALGQGRCPVPVASVVSIEGVVQWAGSEAPAAWTDARLNGPLCSGDAVRVMSRSRAALRLANATTLRLDQQTMLTFIATDDGRIDLRQSSGGLHLMTRTRKPFRVITPFLNAHVEGTEFQVRVGAGAADVWLFEGRLVASNAIGDVTLSAGQKASASGLSAPVRDWILRPANAVQWALHFPTVLDAMVEPARPSPSAAAPRPLDEDLDARIASGADADALTLRAGLRLNVGRVEEAEADLDRAESLDPVHPETMALKALIKLVTADTGQALEIASRATRDRPDAPAPWIVRSYVHQARFELRAATESIDEALRLRPQSGLAWARKAELALANGRLRAALKAAGQATSLAPTLSRTQTVLGFAHLARIEVAAAIDRFEEAVRLDSSDPLPRLGLGLATIRAGALARGREHIEIAAALDPQNSLLRSYLGKAYHDEQRDAPAEAQLRIAKELDPLDPTPHYYDALRKQAGGEPGEALSDLERSIALNDNRAIYRSRLLLDQDRAARETTAAATYAELGLQSAARDLVARSLALDPGNASAHRFLSTLLAQSPRQEIGQSSELLQAQLLQPLSATAPSPQISYGEPASLAPLSEDVSAPRDLGQMFERNAPHLRLALTGGGQSTRASDVSASVLADRLAFGIGRFTYASDGYRPNAGITHEIYNTVLQFEAAPELALQAEYRERRTAQGDIAMQFDTRLDSPVNRDTIVQSGGRLGITMRPAPGVIVLGSLQRARRFDTRFRGTPAPFDIDIDAITERRFDELQAIYIDAEGKAALSAGVGRARVEEKTNLRFDFTRLAGIPCLDPILPCTLTIDSRIRQANGYLYASSAAGPGLTITLGLSRDVNDDPLAPVRAWNPKFGLQWAPTPTLDLRLAAFRSMKRLVPGEQTIEPTQVAGFSQWYDDTLGSQAETHALSIGWRPSDPMRVGAEWIDREISIIGFSGLALAPFSSTQRERRRAVDLHWRVDRALVLRGSLRSERFDWPDPPAEVTAPASIRTLIADLFVRKQWATRVALVLRAEHRNQVVRQSPASTTSGGRTAFALMHLSAEYLPTTHDKLTLEAINLFDTRFRYQDLNFRSDQIRPSDVYPGRRIVLKYSRTF